VEGVGPLRAIACPSVSLCIAVDAAGNVASSTDPAGGAGTWKTAQSGAGHLLDVSCPSTRLCLGTDGGRNVAVSTNPSGGAWRAARVDSGVGPECGKYQASEGCDSGLTGLSCASVSLCVAVDYWGDVFSSSNPARGAHWWSGSEWGGGPDLHSLSCPSDSLCVAACPVGVGLVWQGCPGSEYDAGDVVWWNPSSPTAFGQAFSFTTISSSPLFDVSCASASLCLASNEAGELFVSTNPSGGTSAPTSGASAWTLAYGAPALTRPSAPAARQHVGASGCAGVVLSGCSSRVNFPTIARLEALASQRRSPLWYAVRIARRRHRRARPYPNAGASRLAATASVGPAYGIADTGQPPSPATSFSSYYSSCWFQLMTVAGYGGSAKCFSGPPSPLVHPGPFQYVRLIVPWDVLAYWNANKSGGAGCDSSPAYASGGRSYLSSGSPAAVKTAAQDWTALLNDLADAQTDGLTPEIVIVSGTGIGSDQAGGFKPVPTVVDPSYGTDSGGMWAGWNTSGSSYGCGVSQLMLSVWNAHNSSPSVYPLVTEYEVWNEPNGFLQSNTLNGGYNGTLGYANSPWGQGACGSGAYSVPGQSASQVNACGGDIRGNPENGGLCSGTDPNTSQCGPLEAAGLWEIAATQAAQLQSQYASSGFPTLQVAALTMSDAQNVGGGSYGHAYFNQMVSTLGQQPAYWAVHDYDDTTSTATSIPAGCGATYVDTCDLQTFERDLHGWVPTAQVWVTESGVRLDSTTTRDDNSSSGSPATGPDCADDDSPANPSDPSYPSASSTFGGCVDGNGNAQVNGAQTWENLARVSYGTDTTTEVFWYEFELQNGLHPWDTGLVAPSGGGLAPRPSYCLLYGPGCIPSISAEGDFGDAYLNSGSWQGTG
jgi:hypothetical protein